MHRKSASCTHVSAVLHALVAMTSTGQIHPPDNSGTILPDDEEETSVTSNLCQWKISKERKESDLPMSAAMFEKQTITRRINEKLASLKILILDHHSSEAMLYLFFLVFSRVFNLNPWAYLSS